MYFRSSIRRNPATEQIDSYYRLVESYRKYEIRKDGRKEPKWQYSLRKLTPDSVEIAGLKYLKRNFVVHPSSLAKVITTKKSFIVDSLICRQNKDNIFNVDY